MTPEDLQRIEAFTAWCFEMYTDEVLSRGEWCTRYREDVTLLLQELRSLYAELKYGP